MATTQVLSLWANLDFDFQTLLPNSLITRKKWTHSSTLDSMVAVQYSASWKVHSMHSGSCYKLCQKRISIRGSKKGSLWSCRTLGQGDSGSCGVRLWNLRSIFAKTSFWMKAMAPLCHRADSGCSSQKLAPHIVSHATTKQAHYPRGATSVQFEAWPCSLYSTTHFAFLCSTILKWPSTAGMTKESELQKPDRTTQEVLPNPGTFSLTEGKLPT